MLQRTNRIKILTIGIAIVVTLCFKAECLAQSPVQRWIQQLGSDSFAERESAFRKLQECGGDCLPELRLAIKSNDVELRLRAQVLINQIEKFRKENRLEEFIRSDGMASGLPGWEIYRSLVGNGKEQRVSYTELYEHRNNWLADVGKGKDLTNKFHKWVLEAKDEFISNPDKYSVKTNDALILLRDGIKTPKKNGTESLLQLLEITLLHPSIQKQYQKQELSRKLLLNYLSKDGSEVNTELLISLVRQSQLQEDGQVLWSIVENKQQPIRLRAKAMTVLAKLLPKTTETKLASYLSDATVIGNKTFRGKRLETQLRDVALAMTLQIRKESLADYGFPYHKSIPGRVFRSEPITFGFYSDADRKQAQEKWRVKVRQE